MSKSTKFFVEGEHYLGLGLLTLAKEKFKTALELNQQQRDLEGIGVCLVYLAQIAATEKRKDEALDYLHQAKALYTKRGHQPMLKQLELLKQAIDDISESSTSNLHQIEEKKRQDPFEACRNGDFEIAISIFQRDVSHFRKSNNQRHLGMSLLYLSQAFFSSGQNETSLKYLNEAREIAQQLDDKYLQQAIDNAFHTRQLIEQHREIDEKSVTELVETVAEPVQKLNLALKKAEISLLKGNGKIAENALFEARKHIPKTKPEKYLALTMLVESKIMLFQNRKQQVKKVLELALNYAEKAGDANLTGLIEQSLQFE